MKFSKFLPAAIALIFIIGLTVGSTYFLLDLYERGHRDFQEDVAHQWAHKMHLTSDQESRLEPLESKLKNELHPVQIKLAEERIGLCELMMQKPVDEKKLQAAFARIGGLQAEEERVVTNHLLAMQHIMTSAQNQEFISLMMRGICRETRKATGLERDLCGHCGLKKG